MLSLLQSIYRISFNSIAKGWFYCRQSLLRVAPRDHKEDPDCLDSYDYEEPSLELSSIYTIHFSNVYIYLTTITYTMQDQRLEWLRPKMDELFEKKAKQEAQGKDFNALVQKGREYRNPRICEKLIENYEINQHGSNFSRERFDPDYWRRKQDAHYDASRYRRLEAERQEEKLKISRRT